MAPKSSIKPYKLKATDGPLSRDDLSSWEYHQLSFCRQNDSWLAFLPGGTHSSWTPSDDDETNGLVKYEPDGETQDDDETNKFRSAFKDFLTSVAVNCPSGFTETVLRESTSWKWIIDEIKSNFNLTTKGEQFLAANEIKFNFDNNFTYQQAYMHLRDHYISSMPESGTKFKGKNLQNKGKLSPLCELFIVEKWLEKIDPRLPAHIAKTRGYLFTDERPTLACNQRILADQIETMLTELESNATADVFNIETNNNNFNVGAVNNYRSNRGSGFSNRRSFRGSSNPFPRNQTNKSPANSPCQPCIEAKRYDASLTHSSDKCMWVNQQRQFYRRPFNNRGFKVLLVPTQQNTQDYEAQDNVISLDQSQFNYAPEYNQQPSREIYSADDNSSFPPGTVEEL